MSRQFEASAPEAERGARPGGGRSGGSPNVDFLDEGDRFVVTADLPGFDKENIDVRLVDQTLRIRAQREDRTERGEGNYVRQERSMRSVSRSIDLPDPVAEDDVSAEYRHGVLTVRLPKTDPETDGRRIDIE